MLKKRFITIILASLMVTSAGFAGCAKSKPKEAEVKELLPVTLKWYVDATPQNDTQLVLDEVNKKLDKIKVKLDLEYIDWGAYDEKMKMKAASNEDFDLCFTAAWANNIFTNVSKGAFIPIDELLNKYGKTIKSTLPAMILENSKINGKIYDVPNYTCFPRTKGFWVKKDLADKYKNQFDFSKVKSFEDMEPFFELIKKNEPNITPYTPFSGNFMPNNIKDGLIYDAIISDEHPVAANAKTKDFKAVNLYETTEQIGILNTLRNWNLKGYMKSDAAITYRKSPSDDIKAGKFAAGLAGEINPSASAQIAAGYGFDVQLVPVTNTYLFTNGVFNGGTAISRTSKNPERAMMLLNMLWEDKALFNMLSYGIEGKHFTKDGEYMKANEKEKGYSAKIQWELGNCYLGYLAPGAPSDVWQKELDYIKNAQSSPYAGFVYNRDGLKKENAAIDAVMSEYLPILYTGSADPLKIVPQMNEKLKKGGLEAVIKDVQTQLDDWKKTNVK